jgi:hypothetical protein
MYPTYGEYQDGDRLDGFFVPLENKLTTASLFTTYELTLLRLQAYPSLLLRGALPEVFYE